MSIPYWPADLPQRVLRDGYSESLPDGRLSRPMEKGPSKTRRRGIGIKQVAAGIVVTMDEKFRLERFWNEETDGGTLPFFIPAQTGDGQGILTDGGFSLLDADGHPILTTSWWLVKFGDSVPTPNAIDRDPYRFRVSFDLMVMP
ncbi:MAG: hypothetical protein ABII76_16775 [Pseudomonadota bacterium]|jgi:hypothetical protein|uniref:hypothetical protein n=1 Tax=Roseixanthobacter finlandensis TaxID=3119922 RepID=UPI00372C5BFC